MIHNITDRERALEAEVERLRAELAALKMLHTYAGACPDDLDPDTRDPQCAACRALMALEKQP